MKWPRIRSFQCATVSSTCHGSEYTLITETEKSTKIVELCGWNRAPPSEILTTSEVLNKKLCTK